MLSIFGGRMVMLDTPNRNARIFQQVQYNCSTEFLQLKSPRGVHLTGFNLRLFRAHCQDIINKSNTRTPIKKTLTDP